MLEKLTFEQESKLAVYRDKYLDIFFKNQKVATIEEVTTYMYWFYSKFDESVNKTPTVILVDSPHQVNVEISKIENNGVADYDNLTNHQHTNYLSAFNSWVSFYDFFDKECFTLDKSEIFNEYKQILDLNIFWSVAFENYVFVSRNAIKFNRDATNTLHSIDDYAIQFRDGFGWRFIHGVKITEDLWTKLQNDTYTFEDFTIEENEEIKNAVMSFIEEKHGSERLFKFISDNLVEIDTFVDKKDEKYLVGTTGGMNVGVYTLFKGNINEVDLAFVRCYCPSTDRMFFLGVDPENTNAKDAIASLYRVPSKLKSKIKHIQRQGERFSTVFTDEGKLIMEKMSKEEYQELETLTGEEYFKLMTYEY